MDPLVFHVNDFNESTMQLLGLYISLCRQLKQPVLPMVIDSYGGELYSLLGMISMIEQTKDIRFSTMCFSKAMSCGAVLLTMGDPGLRYISEHATVMYHEPSIYTMGKASEIKADFKEVARLSQKMFDIMNKQCGQASGFFENLVKENGNADLFIEPADCVKYGIVNKIEIPSVLDLILPMGTEPENVIPYDKAVEYSNIKILMSYRKEPKDIETLTNEGKENIIIEPVKGEKQDMDKDEEIRLLKEKLKTQEDLNVSNKKALAKKELDNDTLKNKTFTDDLIRAKKIIPGRQNPALTLLNKTSTLICEGVEKTNDELIGEIKLLKAEIEGFLLGDSAPVDTTPIPPQKDTPADTKPAGKVDINNEQEVEAAVIAFAKTKGIDMSTPKGAKTAFDDWVKAEGYGTIK